MTLEGAMRCLWVACVMCWVVGCGSMTRQASPLQMPDPSASVDTRTDVFQEHELTEQRTWLRSTWSRRDGSYEWGELAHLREGSDATRSVSARASTRSAILTTLGAVGMGVVVGTVTHELLSKEGEDFPGSTERGLYIGGASAFGAALLLRFLWPDPRDEFQDIYNHELRRSLQLRTEQGD